LRQIWCGSSDFGGCCQLFVTEATFLDSDVEHGFQMVNLQWFEPSVCQLSLLSGVVPGAASLLILSNVLCLGQHLGFIIRCFVSDLGSHVSRDLRFDAPASHIAKVTLIGDWPLKWHQVLWDEQQRLVMSDVCF
jgi:hypothetical protein